MSFVVSMQCMLWRSRYLSTLKGSFLYLLRACKIISHYISVRKQKLPFFHFHLHGITFLIVPWFAVLHCGLIPVVFTHTHQGYFTGFWETYDVLRSMQGNNVKHFGLVNHVNPFRGAVQYRISKRHFKLESRETAFVQNKRYSCRTTVVPCAKFKTMGWWKINYGRTKLWNLGSRYVRDGYPI